MSTIDVGTRFAFARPRQSHFSQRAERQRALRDDMDFPYQMKHAAAALHPFRNDCYLLPDTCEWNENEQRGL
jgi:hypothetical protein